MAWGRTDDRETLDSRVGQLTDREYRARHALMQFCLREHREHGIFPESRLVAAAYGTPKGPRAVTKKELNRFKQIGFVHERTDYTDDQLAELGITWPNENGWLRINAWEQYNPPRDGTNAERQRRYRNRHEPVTNGVTDGVSNAVTNRNVTGPRAQPAPAFSVPSPSLNSQPSRETEREAAWQERAKAADIHSPAAFVRSGMTSGQWPDPAPRQQPPVNMPTEDEAARVAGLIRNGVIGERFELDLELERVPAGDRASLVAQFELAAKIDEAAA